MANEKNFDPSKIMVVTTDEVATGMGGIDEVFGLVYSSNSLPVEALKGVRRAASEAGADAVVGFRFSEGQDTVTAFGTAVLTSQGSRAKH